RRLGILVEILHVGMRRGGVEIEVVLLHVFAMVPFASGEPEEALFEDRIPAIPQGQGKTEALMIVTEPCQTVFAPAIGPGAGMVMRKKVPRGAVGTVVFAHRPPLTFGEVRPPPPPVCRALLGLLESYGFLCHRCHVLLPCQTVRLQTSGHPVHSLDATAAQKMQGHAAHAVRPRCIL